MMSIRRPPTPIDQAVNTVQRLVDLSVSQPDVRMMIATCLDGIVAATAMLWHPGNLAQADHWRLMQDALEFYAAGGNDKGERARAVFAIFEREQAER
jgi:hypothetical protein